jgi:hypothetical protein
MPLSLWGLDDARKNLNNRLDKTGSAAWNAARGRKVQEDDPPPPRTTTSTPSSASTSSSTLKRDYLPPPRKLSQQEIIPPPHTSSANQYADAKSKRPPPPPLPSREHSSSASVTPPLPPRSTSSAVSSESDTSTVRPSDRFNRAPPFPASIQRSESQDVVTNELTEKLAKMRMRGRSPGNTGSLDTSTESVPIPTIKPVSPKPPPSKPASLRPPPPKPASPNVPPAPVLSTKPSLRPRTTPEPPRVPGLKSAQPSTQSPPLPYIVPSLHKGILPKFTFPTPDPECNSMGLQAFYRTFPKPLWEMEQASLFILATLYPSDDKYAFTPKTIEGPISLILRDMEGNAHAENSSVIITNGRKKEYRWRSNMVFSVRNFTTIEGRGDGYFVEETRGVMIHELTHAWQWSCSGMPDGLTEGATSNL